MLLVLCLFTGVCLSFASFWLGTIYGYDAHRDALTSLMDHLTDDEHTQFTRLVVCASDRKARASEGES